MNRLTTDDPQSNFETMMNYAAAKNGEVILRHSCGEDNIPLTEVLARVAAAFDCEITAKDIGDGICMGCCDCPVDALMAVGVQAAELRARLKRYEDTGLMPEEIIPYREEALVERMISWLNSREPEDLEGFCEEFAGWAHMTEEEQEAFMAGFLCGNKNSREDLADMLEGGGLDIF